MSASLDCYRPSGRVHPRVIPLVLAAMAAAVGLSWLYELIVTNVPFIYGNFLLAVVYGSALGMATVAVLRRGEVRNPAVTVAVFGVIVLTALAATYAWAIWRAAGDVAKAYPDLNQVDVAPHAWRGWFKQRLASGWDVRGAVFKGNWVGLVWLVEAGIFFSMAGLVVFNVTDVPYCERCRRWMTIQSGAVIGRDRSDVLALLQARDLAPLITFPDGRQHALAPRIALLRAHCPGCREAEYLTVIEVTCSRNEKQKLVERTDRLATNVVLPPEAATRFSERFGSPL